MKRQIGKKSLEKRPREEKSNSSGLETYFIMRKQTEDFTYIIRKMYFP